MNNFIVFFPSLPDSCNFSCSLRVSVPQTPAIIATSRLARQVRILTGTEKTIETAVCDVPKTNMRASQFHVPHTMDR